jgi:hypothetical protein
MEVALMEGCDVRKRVAAEGMRRECMPGEWLPGDDVRPHHVAAEGVRRKGVAAEAGVAKPTVSASAAKTSSMAASAAMTATTASSAAAGDGAGDQ